MMQKCMRVLGLVLVLILGLMAPLGAVAWAAEPITLTCWVYYSGVQAQEMDRLLQLFNDTVGLEQGIFVEAQSFGGVNDLAEQVLASAREDVGAEPLPDIFAAYADAGYQLYKMGVVADMTPYFTPEEQQQYIDAFISEGRLGTENGLYIFPVAKSTELLLLNQTAWDAFAAATGAQESQLATWEGVVALSKAYFEWTDPQTPNVQGDGHAFFGRDAMANYLLIGSLQLGEEIFQVENGVGTIHFDKAVTRRLWDAFYVPFVSGWFAANGRFRSDDVKTGQIVALVGSTSGAAYFPSEVTADDGSTHAIESSVHMLPNFEGTQPVATQQGAGFMVTSSTPEREQAAMTFLKWFTQPEQNMRFAFASGYLPVTKAANEVDRLESAMQEQGTSEIIREVVHAGAEIATTYRLYTNDPFRGGVAARAVLESTLIDASRAALEERKALEQDGMTYADAVAVVTADDRFEAWYSETLAALESAVSAQ